MKKFVNDLKTEFQEANVYYSIFNLTIILIRDNNEQMCFVQLSLDLLKIANKLVDRILPNLS